MSGRLRAGWVDTVRTGIGFMERARHAGPPKRARMDQHLRSAAATCVAAGSLEANR